MYLARIIDIKILVKQTSLNCKCKFDITTCNSNQELNNDKCQYECKRHRTCKKIIVGILKHVFVRKTCIFKVLLMIQ